MKLLKYVRPTAMVRRRVPKASAPTGAQVENAPQKGNLSTFLNSALVAVVVVVLLLRCKQECRNALTNHGVPVLVETDLICVPPSETSSAKRDSKRSHNNATHAPQQNRPHQSRGKSKSTARGTKKVAGNPVMVHKVPSDSDAQSQHSGLADGRTSDTSGRESRFDPTRVASRASQRSMSLYPTVAERRAEAASLHRDKAFQRVWASPEIQSLLHNTTPEAIRTCLPPRCWLPSCSPYKLCRVLSRRFTLLLAGLGFGVFGRPTSPRDRCAQLERRADPGASRASSIRPRQVTQESHPPSPTSKAMEKGGACQCPWGIRCVASTLMFVHPGTTLLFPRMLPSMDCRPPVETPSHWLRNCPTDRVACVTGSKSA